jgi:hypothetical protein
MERKATTRTILLAGAGLGALFALGGCSYTARDAYYDSRKVVYESRPGSGERISLGAVETRLTDARQR